MGIIKEFREFAVRGNVIDLAVGVIIGASFGRIVTSLVDDVIMPPIGILLGNVDFAELKITLQAATADQPAVTLNYGNFISVIVQFTIVAFAVFILVKALNKARARFEPPPAGSGPQKPPVKECQFCRSEIPLLATKCKFCTAEVPA
jgi:large conductance mechanosensitive channel